MSGHTKGRVILDNRTVRHVDTQVAIVDCGINGMPHGIARANAALIAEAFNVANETGRTPAQLAAERAELVAAIAKVMQEHFDHAKRCNFAGCGCEICESFRPILAKVEGRK